MIIDRFEGDYAVCEREDKFFVNIEKKYLPGKCCEGDVLIYDEGKYIIDRKSTQERHDKIRKLMDELFE